MSRIIAITNQKGGVGKSTTAINLGAALAELRKDVLVVDIDPQGNTTSGLGLNKNAQENTIYECIFGLCEPKDCVKQVNKHLDLLPSNVDLAGAEVELTGAENKETRLRDCLAALPRDYDYVLIDCPPSLGLLTVNALTTADSMLVPIQCEYYALEGLAQVLETRDLIADALNPELEIEGILFTMYDSRNKLSHQVVENVQETLDAPIFKTIIPRSVRLAEAPSYGMSIIEYDKRSAGARRYRKLARELIKRRS